MKGAMFSYAFEDLEIAAYSQLVEAAKFVGDGKRLRSANASCGKSAPRPSRLSTTRRASCASSLMRADDPDSRAKH